jgi:hypothetical protein
MGWQAVNATESSFYCEVNCQCDTFIAKLDKSKKEKDRHDNLHRADSFPIAQHDLTNSQSNKKSYLSGLTFLRFYCVFNLYGWNFFTFC